jgi:hypothetical protein
MQTEEMLGRAFAEWKELDDSRARCRDWLQETEKILSSLDLKASLAEKQQQLQLIEVCFACLSYVEVFCDGTSFISMCTKTLNSGEKCIIRSWLVSGNQCRCCFTQSRF